MFDKLPPSLKGNNDINVYGIFHMRDITKKREGSEEKLDPVEKDPIVSRRIVFPRSI